MKEQKSRTITRLPSGHRLSYFLDIDQTQHKGKGNKAGEAFRRGQVNQGYRRFFRRFTCVHTHAYIVIDSHLSMLRHCHTNFV